MLRAGVGFDVDRAFLVLAKDVLDGIKVMLPHVAESAAVVVPIATESLVNAVRMVRLHRRRAEPKVVIKFRRHRLRGEIGAATPLILLPIKPRRAAQRNLE